MTWSPRMTSRLPSVPPRRPALRLTLRQLGLAYCVRDGVLIICSYDRSNSLREMMGILTFQ